MNVLSAIKEYNMFLFIIYMQLMFISSIFHDTKNAFPAPTNSAFLKKKCSMAISQSLNNMVNKGFVNHNLSTDFDVSYSNNANLTN